MKSAVLAALYRRIGEGLGLLEPLSSDVHTPEQVARAKLAVKNLLDVQLEWRKKGLTVDDIIAAKNAGRM